jgi:hypothetical protein
LTREAGAVVTTGVSADVAGGFFDESVILKITAPTMTTTTTATAANARVDGENR